MKSLAPRARRWRAVVAYDGGSFDGWQSQPGGNAVQDVIERRLAAVLGQPVRIHGSGRTDAGVHALGQIVSFDSQTRLSAERLAMAINARLPDDLVVRHAEEMKQLAQKHILVLALITQIR